MASSYEDGGGGGKPYVDKVHFNVSDGVTDLTIGAPGPDILAKSRQIRTNTLVKRSILKVTRFFRYRYPLIGTRSVLVPVWSHWNSLRSVFRSVSYGLQKFHE